MRLPRGDVVLLDFPQAPGTAPKRRPAIVVQSDHNNSRLTTSIFATATTNIRLAGKEPTQVLVDPASPEGRSSGLVHVSAVKCENVYTLPQQVVVRVVGRLSLQLVHQVDAALKASLALP